jgi:L-lactate dehydrogenase (cytochrome)
MSPLTLKNCHNIADLGELARRRLPLPFMELLDGGSDDEITLRANTTAFDDYDLVPRAVVDVHTIDTTTAVLGQRLAFPLMLAPTGGSRFFHHDGEMAVARAAAKAGALYALSASGTCRLEEVALAADGPKMFQLYVMRDQQVNVEIVRRCRAAGFGAFCITVDCPVSGNRERDRRSGLASRPRRLSARSVASVLRRPAWLWHYLTGPHLLTASFVEKAEPTRAERQAIESLVRSQINPAVSWEELAVLIREWRGPFAIKGILSVGDARRAADIGATAIIVSNHGGRQLDSAIPAIHALGPIVEAVGGRVEVILDGGIRRGTHILKALALGARACSIGRPYLYGLAAGGEAGVSKALDILHSELVRAMQLSGCTDIRAIESALVHRRGSLN